MAHASDELDSLPNDTVLAALDQILADKFAQRKLHYTIAKATAKGDNYVSIVFRINVKFADDSEDGTAAKGEAYSLILKVPPQNEARRKQFAARACFLQETKAFNEFLPAISAFQKTKSVDITFHEYPTCLQCMTEELNEAIFMEDLSLQQYRLFDRFEEMDMSHIALVMRAYAKLHACSLAMKAQQPLEFAKFQNICDFFVQRKDDVALNDYLEQLKGTTLKALHLETDENYLSKLQAYFNKGTFSALLLELLDSGNAEPYAVVCHGDCWNNNILFKYKDNQVVDLRLIDWQILRYSSPLCDLMYFTFACTTKTFRDAHFNEIMNIYYDELATHIERLGSVANELFPRNAFKEQLKCKGAIGLLFAMIVLPVITLKSGEVPDLEALSERIESGETTDLKAAGFLGCDNEVAYRERMREVVIDCIDYGFI